MSNLTIILMNGGAAVILVAILAIVMHVPSRLHRPFAAGHTQRQKRALRRQLQVAGTQSPRRSAQRGLRPMPD